MRGRIEALLAVLIVVAAPLQAQQAAWQLAADQEWCEDDGGSGNREPFCEVRTLTAQATGSIEVDGRPNGGVSVEAWDRNDVEIVARVRATARSQERAEELVRGVEISWDAGRLAADGPRPERRESWVVSYRLRAPGDTDLDVRTTNGGIDVTGISGDVEVRAINGGVSLSNLAGDVRSRTTNGGVTVELADDRWTGDGLDVETTNGSVTLQIPDDYSAELELGTTNGRIDLDFPVTVQGRIGRRLRASLGDGGSPIRAVTTNGSVRVARP
jgi:hypothetical protein